MSGEKIRDFKYSTNANLINSISAKIPSKSIDLYLIAGQSNAAGKAGGILHESMELGVQLLRDLKEWDIASAPFSDYDDSKHNMFLHFAKIVRKHTGRPIGLVPAAMGGVPLSRFLPEENGDLYRKTMHGCGNGL